MEGQDKVTVQPAINSEGRKTIDYPVEGNWDYVDFPMDEHDLEEDSEPSAEFTLRSSEMKSIKLFLPGTLQRKTPLSLAIVLVIAAFVYCLHVFGAFGEDTLVKEEIGLTLTTFKNLIWTSRIPVFVFFGFCYLKIYMDDVPRRFRLTSSKLKTLRVRILISCAFEVALTVVFPAIVRLVQLVWLQTSFEKNHPFTKGTAIRNVIFLVVARLLVLPVFLNFTAEFYLLYYELKQYNEEIQRWKQGQTEARNHFINLYKKIKAAEKIFQLFLVIHLGILLLIFIPAMLSYVERFNAEGTVNRIFLKQQGEKMSDPIIVMDPGTLLKDNLSSSAYHLKMKPGQPILLMELGSVNHGKNHSGTKDERDVAETRKEKVQDPKAQARIILAALVFAGELLALYLPIILLGKINQTFTRIAQTVRYGLKYDEQQERGYLIQNDQVAKEMLKTLEHVEGVQVLGMELTVVKSLVFAVFAPLLTLLIHIMIRDVDISP